MNKFKNNLINKVTIFVISFYPDKMKYPKKKQEKLYFYCYCCCFFLCLYSNKSN